MATMDRRDRIIARLAADPAGPTSKGLCHVCAEVTRMSGAGIMLMWGEIPAGSVCTTNEVSDLIEQLQYALGEGPCIDAYREDRPVIEPDLVAPAVLRWPAFRTPVIDAGALAVFGFPLHVGAVRLGALNLYRDRAGPLSDEQHADGLVMATVAAEAVLMLQADAPPGLVSAGLAEGSDFHDPVHQASGMVAAQLGVGVGHALALLRAYAFGHDRSLRDVAQDVLERALRFDPSARGEAQAP